MSAYRYLPRRRRSACPRVVTLPELRAAMETSANEAAQYANGLRMARLLRRLFPGEWEEWRLGAHRATPTILVGLMGVLLSLVHSRRCALDIEAYRMSVGGGSFGLIAALPFTPKNPRDALYPNFGEPTARRVLVNETAEWLRAPVAKAYGLATEEATARGRVHVLALLVYRLTGLTRWAQMRPDEALSLTERMTGEAAHTAYIALRNVLPLPANTAMPELCAQLDRQSTGKVGLGTLIAYVCRRTGNVFADTSQPEVRNAPSLLPLRWDLSEPAWEGLRLSQQDAARWARAYAHLTGRVQRDPATLIPRIAAQVSAALAGAADRAAIADVAYDHYDPTRFIWRI